MHERALFCKIRISQSDNNRTTERGSQNTRTFQQYVVVYHNIINVEAAERREVFRSIALQCQSILHPCCVLYKLANRMAGTAELRFNF